MSDLSFSHPVLAASRAVVDLFDRAAPAMPTQEQIDAVMAEFEKGDGVNSMDMAIAQYEKEQQAKIARWDYCKTCIDGLPCVFYSPKTLCHLHNTPEHCQKVDRNREQAKIKDSLFCPECGSPTDSYGRCTQIARH